LGNSCYHSAQNILSCRLLSKNIQIRMCKLIFCLWFCMDVNLVSHIKEGTLTEDVREQGVEIILT
jgi:hypothetical protein